MTTSVSLLVAALATAVGAMAGVMVARKRKSDRRALPAGAGAKVQLLEAPHETARRRTAPEESPMKIRVRDVISHLGKDYVVEAVLSYSLGGKPHRLARAADGTDVLWVEPLLDDADDRLLVLREVRDLDMATPPPQSIQYKGNAYLPRLEGTTEVEIAGKAPDRQPGSVRVWRYRAAGDLFLQIEDWSGKVAILAGESVHKGMIDVLPAR